MNVILTIDGREAVPVRAIPMLTNWQVLTPDEIADLAATRAKRKGQAVLNTHRIEGSRVLPVSWTWWESHVVAPLLAIEKKIRAQFADDDIGLQEWRNEALRALPAGVFVWRDELEELHLRKFGQEGEVVGWETEEGEMDSIEVADRFQMLDLEPLVPANWGGVVMEGFEPLLSEVQSGQSRPLLEPLEVSKVGPEKMQRTVALSNTSTAAAKAESSSLSDDDKSWMKRAEEMAREIIARQAKKDLYPSMLVIADEIARRFREAKPQILGTKGKPISGEYIKRHVLNPKKISSAKGKSRSTLPNQGKWGKY